MVGVVGLGHIGGIKANWTKDFNIDHLKYNFNFISLHFLKLSIYAK